MSALSSVVHWLPMIAECGMQRMPRKVRSTHSLPSNPSVSAPAFGCAEFYGSITLNKNLARFALRSLKLRKELRLLLR